MAAYAQQPFPQTKPAGAPPYTPPAGFAPSNGPPGTFAPGTKVQIGSHRVVVEKYLSEGGFAHVYVVRLPKPVDGVEQAVLKRVAVPDKEHLANMRTEVETMKKLKGHRHIVKYIDSHASQLKGGGYEVFLLMEFCSGGGLIDFMNTRLQHRLTEPEILHIFSDVAEGVATMHYLKPPLLHRDLKVENVLISNSNSSRIYKVCDFGSTAPPRPAATSAAEARLIEDDVQRHTTLQYRSPEMIDVYRRQPIDEKSDIWALGVLLYKLCYYTTPFEEVGQMAILNATFKYPQYPKFTDRLKMLIASTLRENPQKRPNIYQVLREVCSMRGKEVPVKDIYAGRTASEVRRNQQLPAPPDDSRPQLGASFEAPTKETPKIPDITPMRRGRPTQPVSQHTSAKPSPSPLREVNHSDPFAALDGSKPKVPSDELSARFPKLDEFSLFQDSGKKFEFEPSATESKPASGDLAQRVTNALADDAFAKAPTKASEAIEPEVAERPRTVAEQTKALESKSAPPKQEVPLAQPAPKRASMVSTGTMTSTSPPKSFQETFDKRPIYRFPHSELEKRPSSQPWADRIPTRGSSFSKRSTPNLASKTSPREAESALKSPSSSRPSLEVSRPSDTDIDAAIGRSRSTITRRPKTINVPTATDSISRGSPSLPPAEPSPVKDQYGERQLPDLLGEETETNITSDIDFLRAKEEEENERKRDKRLSSGSLHMKRSSLPGVSLQGTKNLLAGRFGDAFRKFESGRNNQRSRSPSPPRDREHLTTLTPISGSVATASDDEHALEETEDVSPEVRRELERRRLSMEEKRVANAAAEYKKRLAAQGGHGVAAPSTRAQSIQNKVQSLLKENDKPAAKTASGYGRFTDINANNQEPGRSRPQVPPQPDRRPLAPGTNPQVLRKPISSNPRDNGIVSQPSSTVPTAASAAGAAAPVRMNTGPRPMAPPKPKILRTGQNDTSVGTGPIVAASPKPQQTSNTDNNIPMTTSSDDWETTFHKRYPSLSGLEMVETEIDRPKGGKPPMRMKEV